MCELTSLSPEADEDLESAMTECERATPVIELISSKQLEKWCQKECVTIHTLMFDP